MTRGRSLNSRLSPGVHVVMRDGAIGAVVALTDPASGGDQPGNEVVIRLLSGQTVRLDADQIKEVKDDRRSC